MQLTQYRPVHIKSQAQNSLLTEVNEELPLAESRARTLLVIKDGGQCKVYFTTIEPSPIDQLSLEMSLARFRCLTLKMAAKARNYIELSNVDKQTALIGMDGRMLVETQSC